jgi:alkylated DNA repair protein (DNA oxidative demethylase)
MEHRGFQIFPEALDVAAQTRLVAEVVAAAAAAPFYRPRTPGGKPMSVLQTSLGAVGWISDPKGYRYAPRHPLTDAPWPPMPESLAGLWARYADPQRPADSCLVNLYRGQARMGLHQDADEADLAAPVLSISLGDAAVFRLGGAQRRDATRSLRLSSGDICLLAGPSRLAFHGVDRILAGSSRLAPGGGRINLTLRRALA